MMLKKLGVGFAVMLLSFPSWSMDNDHQPEKQGKGADGSWKISKGQHSTKRVCFRLPCGKEVSPGQDDEELEAQENEAWACRYEQEANAFYQKGAYDKAVRRYKKSLRIRINELHQPDEKLERLWLKLGNSYRGNTRYKKAIRCYDKLLSIREEAYGSDSKEVSEVLEMLGGAYELAGDLETAESFYQRTLDVLIKAHGENHADV